MPSPLRFLALQARAVARRTPALHRPFHALALQLAKSRWGARFIRNTLTPEALSDKQYRAWVARHDRLSAADRRAIAAHVDRMADLPLISVVMPAYATSDTLVKAAIASVRRQLYPHWELCIADDASPGEALWTALQAAAADDPRIKVVRRETNGHICAATNSALTLATGDFVALMDHDDLLSEDALYEVAALLERHPDTDLVYSDEDKIDDLDRRFDPYLKPDWNPELILGHNLVSHLGVYRTGLLKRLGGLREGFEGSQDYDLTLRFIEQTTPDRIRHIPKVLYHWRQTGEVASFSEGQMDRCADAARRAVAEHLARTGQGAASVANQAEVSAWIEVRRRPPKPHPLVTVIVPTRDRADLLARCAEGVLAHTDYQPLELVIVDNGSVEPATRIWFDRLSADPRVRILPAPGPFNFSALINAGAAAARGEVLVLLNNDVFVRDGGWLAELVAHAVRPDVGAVGAKLLFPDGRIQHAGVILGVGQDRVAGHLYYAAEGDHPGYHRHLAMTRNVSAVTAACMALRKSVFDEVGGMDAEALAVAYNDVDLCLKIRAAGYDIVWTPFAELTHAESASRGADRNARFRREAETMRRRWGPQLDADPFYGPNFDRRHSNYRLADPPRRAKSWIPAD